MNYDKKKICDLLRDYGFSKIFIQKAEEKYGKDLQNKPVEVSEKFDYQIIKRQYEYFERTVKETEEILDYIKKTYGEKMETCITSHYILGESTSSIVKSLGISKRKFEYDVQECFEKTAEYLNAKNK